MLKNIKQEKMLREKMLRARERARERRGLVFAPDGVVFKEEDGSAYAVRLPVNFKLEDWERILDRGFDVLEEQGLNNGRKLPMDSYSNLFHFILLSQRGPDRGNHTFLIRYLEGRHRRALLRSHQKTGVIGLVWRLNPHPATGIMIPHAEDKALSAAITTAAIAWCESYGKIMHLTESMTNNVLILDPVGWRRVPPEGMTPGTAQSWVQFPAFLTPLRDCAEKLHKCAEEDPLRPAGEMCFRILTDIALNTGQRSWLPFYKTERMLVQGYYGLDHWDPCLKRGHHLSDDECGPRDAIEERYKMCVLKLREKNVSKIARKEALKFALHCARRREEDMATFAGNAGSEPGFAAFVRLARAQGGSGGGTGAEASLVPMILEHVRKTAEEEYYAAMDEFRDEIVAWHVERMRET